LKDDLEYQDSKHFADILRIWKESESGIGWEEHFKSRGFSSWMEWRAQYFSGLGLFNCQFDVFEISEPLLWIPQLYCGSFTSWHQLCPDRTEATFENVLEENFNYFSEHLKVRTILEKYQQGEDYTLIGLRGKFLGKDRIMLLEGNHRGIAAAMMLKEGCFVEFNSNVSIAIADYTQNEKRKEIFERAFMLPFRLMRFN